MGAIHMKSDAVAGNLFEAIDLIAAAG